jgi:hypothetical protein
MALTSHLSRLTLGQALDLAETMRQRAQDAGPPPGIEALTPRSRAAYDRLIDALNRLPRPLMVLGSLALIAAALVAPDWFEGRMEALSRMPEGLWWLLGAVLSLHFGARFQAHAQDFQREMVTSIASAAEPALPVSQATASPGHDAGLVLDTLSTGPNLALEDWRAKKP